MSLNLKITPDQMNQILPLLNNKQKLELLTQYYKNSSNADISLVEEISPSIKSSNTDISPIDEMSSNTKSSNSNSLPDKSSSQNNLPWSDLSKVKSIDSNLNAKSDSYKPSSLKTEPSQQTESPVQEDSEYEQVTVIKDLGYRMLDASGKFIRMPCRSCHYYDMFKECRMEEKCGFGHVEPYICPKCKIRIGRIKFNGEYILVDYGREYFERSRNKETDYYRHKGYYINPHYCFE